MKQFFEKLKGMDKIAHFGIGGLITALFTIVFITQDMPAFLLHPWKMMLYPFIGTAATALVSVVKEALVDENADWYDLYAALLGSALIFIAVFFGVLFYLGSN